MSGSCVGDELAPPVSWAQRRRELWLSFDVPNATQVSMLTPTDGEDLIIRFVDRTTLQPFCSHIHFYAPVKNFLGMPAVLSRCVRLRLIKRTASEWPRLTKQRPVEVPFLLTYNWDTDATLDEDSSGADDSSTSSASVCQCDKEDEASRVEELPDDEDSMKPADKDEHRDAATSNKDGPLLTAAPASAPVKAVQANPRPAVAPSMKQPLDIVQLALVVAITSVSSIILTYLFMRG
jgi:hypothetical protein